MFNLTAFVSAVVSHHWPIAVALVIAGVVSLAKTKVSVIDAKLPAVMVPYVAVALSFLATACADIVAGQSVSVALIDAVHSAIGGFLIQLPPGMGVQRMSKQAGASSLPTITGIMGGLMAILSLGASIYGCTTSQAASAVSIEQAACLAEETIASVIPPGAVQTAANDIGLVCKDVPVPSIVSFIEQFLANQADAGVAAASGPYQPSAHVLAVKAAK
jgi:hypothetical protein